MQQYTPSRPSSSCTNSPDYRRPQQPQISGMESSWFSWLILGTLLLPTLTWCQQVRIGGFTTSPQELDLNNVNNQVQIIDIVELHDLFYLGAIVNHEVADDLHYNTPHHYLSHQFENSREDIVGIVFYNTHMIKLEHPYTNLMKESQLSIPPIIFKVRLVEEPQMSFAVLCVNLLGILAETIYPLELDNQVRQQEQNENFPTVFIGMSKWEASHTYGEEYRLLQYVSEENSYQLKSFIAARKPIAHMMRPVELTIFPTSWATRMKLPILFTLNVSGFHQDVVKQRHVSGFHQDVVKQRQRRILQIPLLRDQGTHREQPQNRFHPYQKYSLYSPHQPILHQHHSPHQPSTHPHRSQDHPQSKPTWHNPSQTQEYNGSEDLDILSEILAREMNSRR